MSKLMRDKELSILPADNGYILKVYDRVDRGPSVAEKIHVFESAGSLTMFLHDWDTDLKKEKTQEKCVACK
jgi:hypothetical protein